MSTKKDSGPPPRPPAPKSGSVRSSSSNSLKISFKSLEEEDEEDLTTFTGEFEKKIERDKSLKDADKGGKVGKDDRESISRGGSDSKLQKLHSVSKSLEDDKSSINVAKIKQNIFEFSSGLKDKLTKKLEEFSSEPNSSPENEVVDENKIQQIKKEIDDGLQIEVQQNVKLYTSPDNTKPEVKMTMTDVLNRTKEIEKEESEITEKEKSEQNNIDENQQVENEVETIDIVDDFFPDEPHEDFNGTPSLSTNTQIRKRSKLKRGFKNRPTPSASPVSMSTLKKNTVNDIEDDDNGIFFDAEEKSKTSSVHKDTAGNKQTKKTKEEQKKQNSGSSFQSFAVGMLMLVLYWVIPLPSYLSGMILGIFLSSAVWIVYLFLTKPAQVKLLPVTIPLNQLPPMIEPEVKTTKTRDGVFKGWLNEIIHYNPDSYHINKTHSINVHLEDTTLRLRRPKTNIAKRAMWDEPSIQTPKFIHQRHYDLKGSRVFLLPPGLVKKRIWSKKYPICIALAQNSSVKKDDLEKERTPDTDDGFEIVTEQKCDSGVLYLFARTCREKEDWYKRFDAASRGKPLPNHLAEIQRSLNSKQSHQRSSSNGSLKQHQRHGSTDSTSSTSSSSPTHEGHYDPRKDMESFVRYMGRLMPKDSDNTDSANHHYKIDCEPQLMWTNALIGRCFWDFLRQKHWADKVMDKLQKKLAKIHIPYFIEELTITNIDLGNEMPVIRRAGKPFIDEDGFWIDLDVNYEGGFEMTIETKVNLMRLTENKRHTTKVYDPSEEKSAITHSDEEDSAESSTDEEEEGTTTGTEEGASGGKASKKILNFLDKVTQSKYFKSATEMKYIKKAMEEVSNTPLVLTVALRYLSGTLAVNIPPPPTDRFWYGFRNNPKLTLVAKPKVGARQVTVTHITEWIEKKLSVEFQRVLVMPNMDDLVIPILMPDYLSAALPTIPRSQSGSEV